MRPLELKAPFPWFGGKSKVADVVWSRFGDTPNYVEPFAGSLAVLLSRPGGACRNETVNDKDCYLANFWRSLAADPDQVAHWADWPVNEADLHARHKWLVGRSEFTARMKSDPDYCDAKVAGWWVWGVSQWIGSGWCVRPEWTGWTNAARAPRGIHAEGWDRADWNKRPRIGRGGEGVHRAALSGEPWRQKPDISGQHGCSGRGIFSKRGANLSAYFQALAERLQQVRVCCGEWDRVLGPSPTTQIGITAVFLDPPYDLRHARSKEAGSDGAAPADNIYFEHDHDLSHRVRAWAIQHGDDPLLRIALCGYDGEHEMPDTWACAHWKANGGYGNQGAGKGRANASRERVWFSPHCLPVGLFERSEVTA
jgi:hypothetical protein